eukprot:357381-Chlamydomonas_euryale.AAC.23
MCAREARPRGKGGRRRRLCTLPLSRLDGQQHHNKEPLIQSAGGGAAGLRRSLSDNRVGAARGLSGVELKAALSVRIERRAVGLSRPHVAA